MNAKLATLLLLLSAAMPATAAKRVSLEQFDQVVAKLQGQPDDKFAHALNNLELQDRVSLQRLKRWKAEMPGDKSLQALTVLADASVFMSPPADEMPKMAAMDGAAQQKLFLDATSYIDKTLARLPNFFATEVIILYGNKVSESARAADNADMSIRFQGRRKMTVLYRDGKEVMKSEGKQVVQQDQRVSADYGLLSSGEFGPVLSTVLADAQKGKLTWGRWEAGPQGEDSQVAVFHYSVPRKLSHYKVKVDNGGKHPDARPGYHGEIGIDPKNGAIVRLTLIADLMDDDPLGTADLMVQYGPVEIGGLSYICPIRSVAIAKPKMDDEGRTMVSHGTDQGLHDSSYGTSVLDDKAAPMILNDVAFQDYHVLRSDAPVVTPATNDQN